MMRTSLLTAALMLLALCLGYDYVKVRKELDSNVREVRGLRLEIAHGKYDRVFEKTITVPVTRTKIVYRDIYVPPEGSITVTPIDKTKTIDEVVEVKVKWYGLTFRPGLQLGLLPLGAGLDFKLAFVNRLGFTVGALVSKRDLSPTLALAYRLDRISLLNNTEVQCGYAPLNLFPAYCGLRINL